MEFGNWLKRMDTPHHAPNLCLSPTSPLSPASLTKHNDTVSTPGPKENHSRSLIGASPWLRGL